MEPVMSMDEIESRYDGEWVLILDPATDESNRVLGGRVAYHSPDRDEFDRKSLNFSAPTIAVRYIGEPSRDMEFVL